MILDKLMQFDAAATAAAAIIVAGVDSSNTLDLLNARELAIGHNRLVAVFTITTTFLAAGGAASLIIQLKGSADNVNFNVLDQTDQAGIPKANLLAGTVIHLPLGAYFGDPRAALPRYLKLTYLALTNPFTAGAFECDMVVDPQVNNAPNYAAGIVVAN